MMRARAPFRAIVSAVVLVLAALAPSYAQPEDAKDNKPFGFDTGFFKGDQPIEITADALDVDQTGNTAIFQGNVNAVQGDVVMRSDNLTVYYANDEAKTPAASEASPSSVVPTTKAASDPLASTGQGKIRRMEVTGGVHVSSPSETASGDRGVYDVEADKITLTGNVILTRGENVLRGSKMLIDVASGKSVIQGGGGNTGRVKGVFLPKSANATNSSAGSPPPGP